MQRISSFVCVVALLSGVAYASFLTLSWYVLAPSVIVAVVCIGIYATSRKRQYLIAFLAISLFLLGGVRTTFAPKTLPPQFAPYLEKKIAFDGTLVAPPDVREQGVRLTVEVEKAGIATRVLAAASPGKRYQVGDLVRVTGVLTEPAPFATDGGRTFAYDRFLAKDGIFALMQPASVSITGSRGGVKFALLRTLQRVHDLFVDSLENTLPEPESALAVGLIAGGKQGLGKPLLEAFTIAGLLPIVVLSGYNVMIVADGVRRALRMLPRRAALAVSALAVMLFILAAGGGSSAVRAGVMALLGIVAQATRRTYDVTRALFAALALMVLWNPLVLVFDPGLQFSFAATLGLVVGSPLVERRLLWIRYRFMRTTLASTVAAQAAVLPLLLYETGNLSLVSIAANMLVLPMIPAAMAASAFAAAASLAPFSMAVLLSYPAYLLLAYVIRIAEIASSLPLAHVVVPAFPLWVAAVGYAILTLLVVRLKRTSAAGNPAALKYQTV